MVVFKQQLVSSRSKTSKGTNSKRYITIHETGNTGKGAGAQAHANLQSNGNSRDASWHIQIDDKQAIQSFPYNVICWHTGNGVGNSTSIGVEICVNSDSDFNLALQNAADVVAKIMKDENIPLTNVVQHNRWSGKNCPSRLRSGSFGVNWDKFKSMVAKSSGATTTTQKDFLQRGDKGSEVKDFQSKLKALDYQIDVDGSFGPGMLEVVKKFQKENNLKVDGFLGPATQKTIEALLKQQKGDDEQLNLAKSEREELAKIFKHARKQGIFLSDAHEKSIVDGTMTLSRLQYLQTIIAGAGINGGKRI